MPENTVSNRETRRKMIGKYLLCFIMFIMLAQYLKLKKKLTKYSLSQRV